MFHHARHGERGGDDHHEGGRFAADGSAHHGDGERLRKRQQNNKRDGANEIHQQVDHQVDGLILQDAARAGGVEQNTEPQAQNAGDDEGGRDHDEGVDDGIDKRSAQAVPVGGGEIVDVHRSISSI